MTKDDISAWLNGKPMAVFVSAGMQEHRSITVDGSPYAFLPSQIPLTGFSRHDELLEKSQVDPDILLIMPTWRKWLVGPVVGKGNKRERLKDFADTEYCKRWNSLLNSPDLLRLAEKTSKKIVFFPHANIASYIEEGCFSVPDYVVLAQCDGKSSIQNYFARASVMVTDYSSVAFECAYIQRPVIYYQFDEDRVFSGDHIYARGYFDYRRDGFGPVVKDEMVLLSELKKISDRDYLMDSVYQERVNKTFAYFDGKCCERIYEALKERGF